ncbi:MAG: DUF115 domain-containing protein [Cyclobacteriaceae bacterium]|nr:DUF115 domain-containing protein [Cyclobacteriaceae bacterium HetDA_MAG_MS6]
MNVNKWADGLKSVEEFISKIYQSFISLVKVLLLSKFNAKIPQSDRKTCFILGNGPSLKSSIEYFQELFGKNDVLCVNHFAQTAEYQKFKPENYVLLDPNFFLDDNVTHDPKAKNTLEVMARDTSWQMNIFIPRSARRSKSAKSFHQNPNLNIVYFNYTIVSGLDKLAFALYKRNLGFPVCQNVLGASILLALNMGYQRLYVFGADHSWLQSFSVNEQNELVLSHQHFYTQKDKPLIAKVYSHQENKVGATMSEFLTSLHKAFEVYHVLKRYAAYRGTEIFNASEVSFIDAFPRKKP